MLTREDLDEVCEKYGLIANTQASSTKGVPYECHWVAFQSEKFKRASHRSTMVGSNHAVELWTSGNGKYGLWKFNLYIVADGENGHLELTDDWGERSSTYPIWSTDKEWLIERLDEFFHNFELLCEEIEQNSIKRAGEDLLQMVK